MTKINYVEMPVKDVERSQAFYGAAFGFGFTGYGPDYAAMEGGDVALGLNGSDDHPIPALLALIEVDDLEAALEKVVAAGGAVTVPIFAFPGGRRFHFNDPDGNGLGVFVNEPDQH